MGTIEWDGIYGESDTFLPVDQIDGDEAETSAATYTSDEGSLLDLDRERSRRRPR